MDVSEWVRSSVKQNVSDLHLCSGHPPIWRIDGQLVADAAQPPLHNAELEQWCHSWLEPACEQQLRQSGQTDCALTLPEGQRLRANLFMQRHGLSAALRLIPSHQPDLQTLGAPPVAVVFLTVKPGRLYLGKLAVDASMRGQGLARRLVAQAETRARILGLPVVELETRVELVENHATFARLGFAKTGETAHPGYDRPTSITMQKRLF